jgi:multimeric flavodoxin WrbA
MTMHSELSRRTFLTGVAATTGTVALAESNADGAEGKESLKIVGIVCSPRKGKTTATTMSVCLDAARQVAPEKIETELIELAEMSIPGQLAAGEPLRPGEKDDFPSLVPKLSSPEVAGIVIGTPVYFANMTYLCKAFLDRCVVFRKNKFALANKIAGVAAVGGCRNGGQELTIRSVQVVLMSHQMIVVGDAPPTAHFGATVCSGGLEDVKQDEFGMTTARNLGKRVAEMAMLVHG